MTAEGDVGAPPQTSARDAEDQKHLTDRIAELRKSSETLGGWCLGSIIAACLRDPAGPNKFAMTCGVAGVVMGLVGSSPMSKHVNRSALTAHLKKTYQFRAGIRVATIAVLLMGLCVLVVSAWVPDRPAAHG